MLVAAGPGQMLELTCIGTYVGNYLGVHFIIIMNEVFAGYFTGSDGCHWIIGSLDIGSLDW